MGTTSSTPESDMGAPPQAREDILRNVIEKLKVKTEQHMFKAKKCKVCVDTEVTSTDTNERFPNTCGFLCKFSRTLAANLNKHNYRFKKHSAKLLREQILKWLGKCIVIYATYLEFMEHYTNHNEIQEFYAFTPPEMKLFCMVLSWCHARLSFLREASLNQYIAFFPNLNSIEKNYPAKDHAVKYLKHGLSHSRYTDYWMFFLEEKSPGKLVAVQFYRDPLSTKHMADVVRNETEHGIEPLKEASCRDKGWKIELEDDRYTHTLKKFFRYYESHILTKAEDKAQVHKIIGKRSMLTVAN